MTAALWLLRCKEAGLALDELDELGIGFIFDMFIEKGNDGAEYDLAPTQEDFDRF